MRLPEPLPFVPRVSSRAKDAIREARAALETGDACGAIRVCEQARAHARVSEDELAQLFALLGRAHVALGEHETALTFLKRADDDADAREAARVAHEALHELFDAGAFFERATLRAKRKRMRRIALVAGAIVLLPVLLVCGTCGYRAYDGYAMINGFPEALDRAVREGEALGRSGTAGDCIDRTVTDLAGCVPSFTSGAPTVPCTVLYARNDRCLTVTDWTAFCETVPPPTLDSDAPIDDATPHAPDVEPWARAQCAAHPARTTLEGEDRDLFDTWCAALLTPIPLQCRDPSLRPAFEGYTDAELDDVR